MNYAINPLEIYKLVNKDVYLVDIREYNDFRHLHIKNFVNIPYPQFSQHTYLPKNQAIYIICQYGQKAKQLCHYLRQNHYDAYYIDGGFQAFLNLPSQKYY